MSSKSAPDGAGRRRPWPLAARLTAWYAAWSFALVLVATGFLYWGLVASLDGEDDEELADKVRVLRAALRDRPGDLLRTPVNNLRGEAEVALARPRSAEEYRDALGSCLEECGRLSRLIDSLLFLARAEGPRTQVEREPLDLARELAAVREFYEPQAAEAGVTLALAAPGEVVAELNRPLLQRAVGNLVANALAHTPAGGRVTLSAAREMDRVRVAVADTGCGIPEAHQPRLFERFYRVDRARSSASGGVGLGLAIVKGIAEMHGGSVALDSAPGRGTRVTLLLPARPPAAGPANGTPPPPA